MAAAAVSAKTATTVSAKTAGMGHKPAMETTVKTSAAAVEPRTKGVATEPMIKAVRYKPVIEESARVPVPRPIPGERY